MTAPATIGVVLADARARLAAAGIEGALLDARLLVADVAAGGMTEVMGYPERPLGGAAQRRLRRMVERRRRREPVARILGHREFWSLNFKTGRDALIPRPDSETLVEAALNWAGDRERPYRVLDLGTGTGCLVLAVLSELPRATGLGLDISDNALAVARENARALEGRLGLRGRVRFLNSDWGAGVEGRFDLVLANPPYIPDGDIAVLEPEVALYEPGLALRGGVDGLDCYRRLVPRLNGLVAEGGAVFLETGAGQAGPVAGFLRENGFQSIEIKEDLAGIPRCVIARRAWARGVEKKRLD